MEEAVNKMRFNKKYYYWLLGFCLLLFTLFLNWIFLPIKFKHDLAFMLQSEGTETKQELMGLKQDDIYKIYGKPDESGDIKSIHCERTSIIIRPSYCKPHDTGRKEVDGKYMNYYSFYSNFYVMFEKENNEYVVIDNLRVGHNVQF